MLVGEELAGPAQPGLHLVADQQRAVLVQQGGRRGQEAGRHHVHALALDRLDEQRGHVAPAQFGGQRVQVAERDHGVRQQRGEAAAELRRAVDRQRPGGQPVERVVAVDDPAPPGGVPGELQRRLDRLGAAVAEVHPVQPGRLGQQPLGQQAGQQRGVELDQVGEFRVEHLVQRLPHHRVVPPDPEHAEPGQEVGVPVAVGVIQIGALGPLVRPVEADGVQRPRQLGVQVPVGQGVALPVPGREQVRQVKSHGDKCADSPRLLASRGAVRRYPGRPGL